MTGLKEVQDSSCRGTWGCPPYLLNLPHDWGIKGVDQDFFSTLQMQRLTICMKGEHIGSPLQNLPILSNNYKPLAGVPVPGLPQNL